jgi:hypothetical protein
MASLRGQLARSTEKRGGAGQHNVVENGEVEVPFIGLERRGGSRLEELNGGRGVRFEIGHFEDEWDTVRHRFIGQKEGGRAALQFGSPCVEEGTAHGAAMLTERVAAAQASEGRRRCQRWAKLGPKQKRAGRLDGPPW